MLQSLSNSMLADYEALLRQHAPQIRAVLLDVIEKSASPEEAADEIMGLILTMLAWMRD